MFSSVVGYPALFALAVFFALGATLQAWQVRDEPGGTSLVVTLLGMALWAGCILIVSLVPGTEIAVTFIKLRFLGVSIMITAVFVFVLSYTGYDEYVTRRTVGLLCIWPVVLNYVVWFQTDLIWASLLTELAVGTRTTATYSPVLLVHISYMYSLLVVATFLLVRFTLTNRFLYQKQVAAIIIGITAPWATNIAFIGRITTQDLTVVGFVFTGLALTWAIQREKFLDVTPVARNKVVETLSSSVFVIDSDNRLVDSNQQGMELLGITPMDIGKPVTELLETLPADVAQEFKRVANSTEQETFSSSIKNNHYEIEVTPLYDDREYLVGRVFLIHDITEQKHRQEQLERQNNRLDQFASVVSHDLRSPIGVASGYAELARQDPKSTYFDEIEESHRRMEQLIDELLAFAQLDDGEIETESIDPEYCAKTAWGHVETENAELVVDCAPETEIEANCQQFLQLLENLIRNSIEHGIPDDETETSDDKPNEFGSTDNPNNTTEPVLTLKITVDQLTADEIELTVSDDGSGIPVDDRKHVQQEGYTTGDGIGLGLAIVSGIAEAHDWSVTVTESKAGGAAFVFEGISPA